MTQYEMNFEIGLTEQAGFSPAVAQRQGRKALFYNKRYAVNTKIDNFGDRLTSFNNVQMTNRQLVELAHISGDTVALLELEKRYITAINTQATTANNIKDYMNLVREIKVKG